MSDSREDRIRDRVARQHGVVTRTQLLAAGFSSSAIGRRLTAGRLRLLHSGVYLVGLIEPPRAGEMAAVLAGGPTAVLSHTNALRAWGMSRSQLPRPVHVTVPGSGRAKRAGIRFHRVATLDDDERGVIDGIPITSPGRTLADVAGLLGQREIERAVALAEREGLIAASELSKLPDRYSGRPGIAALRTLIDSEHAPDLPKSEAERRCIDLLAEARLPRPHVNVSVGPYELDLFWPDLGVAIEIDGRAYHSSRSRFEGDRRNDRWLRARGIQVVRLTWRQITRESLTVAVEVSRILAIAEIERRRGRATRPAGETDNIRDR